MLEAVDADVPCVLARAPLGAAVMAEDGGALMLRVLAPQFPLRGEHGVTAAGIDHVAGLKAVTAAVIRAHIEPRFARTPLLYGYDLVTLASIRAAFARMLIEHLVEILPPYLIGV